MNIVQKCNTIAVYMGGKYSHQTQFQMHPDDIWLPIHGILRKDTVEFGKGPIMSYHIDWHWLMPAWSKIYNECLSIMPREKRESFAKDMYLHTTLEQNIEKAFNVVYEMVEWFNQRK
jgi:hypothetical protein